MKEEDEATKWGAGQQHPLQRLENTPMSFLEVEGAGTWEMRKRLVLLKISPSVEEMAPEGRAARPHTIH